MSMLVGEGVVRVVPDLSGFGRSVSRRIDNQFERVGAGAQQAALALAPLSLAAGAAIAASANLAIQFERDFVKIEALVGESVKNLEALAPAVLRLASVTGRGPAELSEALFFVESAGLRGKKALDVLEASAKAAAVGLGETKVVADAVTSAVNAYAVQGLTASRATDALVAAVRLGKIEADSLAMSVGRVIPVGAALGVTFDQVAAALAAATRVGLSAEEATTALRQIFVTLLKPSAEAQNTLESYGLSAEGLRKQIKDEGLLATLQTLTTTFQGNVEATNKVFQNVRALTGVFALVGENSAQVQGIFDELRESTGELETAFEKTQRAAKFKLEQALASLQATAVTLGSTMLPPIAAIAEKVSELAQAFQNLPLPMQRALGILTGVVALSAPVAFLLGTVVRTVGAMQALRSSNLALAQSATAVARASGSAATAITAQGVAAQRAQSGMTGFQRLLVGPGGGGGASLGARLAKSTGIFLGTELVAGLIGSIETAEGTVENKVQDVATGAIRGAGLGAAFGSIVPVIGTGLGAAAGAVLGGITAHVRDQANEIADVFEETIIPPEELRATAFSEGTRLGLEIVKGFGNVDAGVAADNFFADLEASLDEQMNNLRDPIEAFGREIPSMFEDGFEEESDLTWAKIRANTTKNLESLATIDEVVQDLFARGFTGLAQQLQEEAGPQALAAAQAIRTQLIDDPTSVFNLEADILRLEGETRSAFLRLFQNPESLGLSDKLRDFLPEDDRQAIQNSIVDTIVQARPDVALRLATVFEELLGEAIVQAFKNIDAPTLTPDQIISPDERQVLLENALPTPEELQAQVEELFSGAFQGEQILEFGDIRINVSDFVTSPADREFMRDRLRFSQYADDLEQLYTDEANSLVEGVVGTIDFQTFGITLATDLNEFLQSELETLLAAGVPEGTIKDILETRLVEEMESLTAEKIVAGLEDFQLATQIDTALAGGIVNYDFSQFNSELREALASGVLPTGESLPAGFLEGWENLWPGTAQAITDQVGALESSIRSKLEAQSPSRVYYRIGRDIMLGLNEGIMSVPIAPIAFPEVAGPKASQGGGGGTNITIYNPNTHNLVDDSARAITLATTMELI